MPTARFADLLAIWTPLENSEAAHEYCDSVLGRYLTGDDSDRAALRAAVRRNQAIWNPNGDDALSAYLDHADAHLSPVESLRAELRCVP